VGVCVCVCVCVGLGFQMRVLKEGAQGGIVGVCVCVCGFRASNEGAQGGCSRRVP